ncbi:MAG: hypothetical protein ABSB63_22875 [Spirochaetia bacterium]|jgi:hypothetical protein
MIVVLNNGLELSDERSESSYGIPVAIIDGVAYGPADLLETGEHAAQRVEIEAGAARFHGRITDGQFLWCSKFWK